MSCKSCGAPTIVTTASGGGLCAVCLLESVRRVPLDVKWVQRRFPQLSDVECARDGEFKARDFESGEKVRLHLISTGEGGAKGDALLRAIEGRSLLVHPQISAICDHGEIDDAYIYVIESVPEGEALSEAIRGADISRSDMLDLLPKIMEIVRYAAAQGVALASHAETVYLAKDGKITLSGILGAESSDPGKAVAWIESHPAVGTRVGPYELVKQIGEGGFAEVYLARQERPVRRDVALKILKLGMDTRQVLARFAMEREALSRMEHSGIAKIYDAGATEAGRPYIVMELVDGVPLTSYCDSRSLSIEERAGLMAQVCRAVEHGNSKGVIHRDLKPSNVLVCEEDGKPLPKVIDFGIARAAEEPLTANTFFTRTQQFIGSPSYMSPEQVDGNGEIDARSDVFSLGCVWFELLVGETPLAESALAGKGLREVIGHIQSVPADHPADCFSRLSKENQQELAEARSSEAGLFVKALTACGPSEVALKALSKRPSSRYANAAGMAEDLEAWVKHQTVTAPRRRRRAVYRLKKAAMAIVTFALLCSSVWYFNPLRRKPAVSRGEDGSIRPVALFQFDDSLKSAIPGGPDMVAWGAPEMDYGTAQIAGEDARVLHFQRLLPSQWFKCKNEIGVNGPSNATETNRWTLVYDVMFPSIAGPIALFQCHSENFGEAEMYVGPGGIGSRFGLFYGQIREGEWYRIVIVSSDNDRAQLYTTYVNGTRWGVPWVKGMHSAGYAFDDEFLFFCEGDQRTGEICVNSIAIYDVPLSDDEVRSLGSAGAGGVPPVFKPGAKQAPGGGLFASSRVVIDVAQANDKFGSRIGMSTTEVWISAPNSSASAERGGMVYRYRQESDGEWNMAGRVPLSPELTQGANFGAMLDLGKDAGIIGAPGAGAAFLYRRDEGGDWNDPVLLKPENGRAFGAAVALGDGVVFVADRLSEKSGSVYLFDRATGEKSGVLAVASLQPEEGFGSLMVASGPVLAVASSSGPVRLFEKQAAGYQEMPGEISETAVVLALSQNGSRLALKNSESQVRIYRRNAMNEWKMEAEILAPDGSVDSGFGASLVFASSTRLIVGAPKGIWEGKRTGVAFLMEWDGGAWRAQRTIMPETGSQEGDFGASLACAGDQLWVGGNQDHTDRPSGGAAFPVRLPRFENQRFPTVAPVFTIGSDVALEDGLAAVGSPGIDHRAYGGDLKIFRLDETGRWEEQDRLIPSSDELPNGSFSKVAVGDGRVCGLVGGKINGYVWRNGRWELAGVLDRDPTDMTMLGNQLLLSQGDFAGFVDLNGDRFGGEQPIEMEGFSNASSLALDGARLLISRVGGVRVFARLGTEWTRAGELRIPDVLPVGARFGSAIDIDGGFSVVGAPTHDGKGNGIETGAAFVFEQEGSSPVALACPETEVMPAHGWSVAIVGDVALVGNPYVRRGLAPGRVYVYRRDRATGNWRHSETLMARNAEPGDEFGISIAMDDGWAVIGAKSSWVYFFRM